MLLRIAFGLVLLPSIAFAQQGKTLTETRGLPGAAQTAPAASGGGQSRVYIGGVDQRLPAMEAEFLSQEVGRASRQLAKAAAMLALEKEDRAGLEKQVKDLSEKTKKLQETCGDPCKDPEPPKEQK